MAFQQPPPHAPEPPRKLDVHLEAVAAFQAGAATLQAGTALALREKDGRLTAVTQGGTAVGLVPADKRQLLSRGPWAGTVRSVKRQPASSQSTAAVTAAASQQQAADAAQLSEQQPEQQQQQSDQQHPASGAAGEQQQQAAAAPPAEQAQGPPQPPAGVVVQVLVRFTPEEQHWAQRQAAGQLAQPVEEDTARLSTEQFEALAANEELRWMLRDERLQKVVSDIDAAPDRERALLRALQAPNFKEFADKVLNVVAPEAS